MRWKEEEREALVYELSGNLKREGYKYDSRGRLISAPGVEYSYDAFDRRIAKQFDDGTIEEYLYDGLFEVGRFDGEGLDQFRILGLGLGGDIGAMVSVELGGEQFTPVSNHRGDLVQLLSSDEVRNARYSVYGETNEAISPWGFSSKRSDEETGLSYFGGRFYDPEIGQWLSPDPCGCVDGPNLYGYVGGRPTTQVDPFGWTVISEVHEYWCDNEVLRHERVQFLPDDYVPSEYCEEEAGFDPFAVSYTSLTWQKVGESIGRHIHNRTSGARNAPALDEGWDERCNDGNHSFAYRARDGKRPLPSHCYAIYINGIGTSFEEAVANHQYLCDLIGYDIWGVWNATHRIVKDMLECGRGLHRNIATTPAKVLADLVMSIVADDPDAVILIFCHSQGGIHTKHGLTLLPEEVRRHIMVLALTPGMHTNRELCLNIETAGSMRDFVWGLDLIGLIRNRGHMRLLRSRSASWFDHSVVSPTFEDPILQSTRDLIQYASLK